eukprot:UN33225
MKLECILVLFLFYTCST